MADSRRTYVSNRTIRSILENGPELHTLPSGADLDAVAEEQRIQERDGGPKRTFPPNSENIPRVTASRSSAVKVAFDSD